MTMSNCKWEYQRVLKSIMQTIWLKQTAVTGMRSMQFFRNETDPRWNKEGLSIIISWVDDCMMVGKMQGSVNGKI